MKAMINLIKDFNFNEIMFKNFINLSSKEKEVVRNLRNNRDVSKWMFTNRYIEREEHESFIQGLAGSNSSAYWLVKGNKGKYLGVISLTRLSLQNKNAYLGMYVNPCCRSQGTGTLIFKYFKKIVFNVFKLHSLRVEVIQDNSKAILFYKKIGFIKEGVLREFVYKNRKWCSVIIMGILKRDFSGYR